MELARVAVVHATLARRIDCGTKRRAHRAVRLVDFVVVDTRLREPVGLVAADVPRREHVHRLCTVGKSDSERGNLNAIDVHTTLGIIEDDLVIGGGRMDAGGLRGSVHIALGLGVRPSERNRIVARWTLDAADHGKTVLLDVGEPIPNVRARLGKGEHVGVDPLRAGGFKIFNEVPRLLGYLRPGGEVRASTLVVVELFVDLVEHRGLAVLIDHWDKPAQDGAGGSVGKFAPVDAGLGMVRRFVIVVVGGKKIACMRGACKASRKRANVFVVHEHAVQCVVEHDRVARAVGMCLVWDIIVRDVPLMEGMRIGGIIQRNRIVPWLSAGRDHVVVRLGADDAKVFVRALEHRVSVWHNARVDVLYAARFKVLHLVGVRIGECRHGHRRCAQYRSCNQLAHVSHAHFVLFFCSRLRERIIHNFAFSRQERGEK